MSAIIYEKTANGLYPTGQRTVAKFPSGLIRVEQTFVCKTSAEATHRAALEVGEDFPNGSDPSFDGLKIFPESQEIRRGDGFTEFKVAAYGRANATGISSPTKVIEYSKRVVVDIGAGTGPEDIQFLTIPKKVSKVYQLGTYNGEIDFSSLTDPVMKNPEPTYGLSFEDFLESFTTEFYGNWIEVSYVIARY
jgi:hypothetical protein